MNAGGAIADACRRRDLFDSRSDGDVISQTMCLVIDNRAGDQTNGVGAADGHTIFVNQLSHQLTPFFALKAFFWKRPSGTVLPKTEKVLSILPQY